MPITNFEPQKPKLTYNKFVVCQLNQARTAIMQRAYRLPLQSMYQL